MPMSEAGARPSPEGPNTQKLNLENLKEKLEVDAWLLKVSISRGRPMTADQIRKANIKLVKIATDLRGE
jgi:hypothetical protein